jgi:hypothetical protein
MNASKSKECDSASRRYLKYFECTLRVFPKLSQMGKGDLIEVFKIMKGLEDVNKEIFFTMDKGCTRGHELELFKHNCRLDCRKYAFSNRIVNMWNSLPSNITACNTVHSFKRKIDVYLYSPGFI